MARKSNDLIKRHDELIEDAWLNVDITAEELFNPLEGCPEDADPHKYILWLFSNPEYFAVFCKHVLNITLHPFQCVILRELWNKKFPMLIGSRGLSKTFMMAVYITLRMLFIPGRKVIVTGAGFRQSKLVFEYLEKIWTGAPILRSLAGTNGGFIRGTDAYEYKIGESKCWGLPIGDGTKIRGYRAHDIITDEFAVCNPEILEHVIFGFAAVSADPIGNIRRKASIKKAKFLGVEVDIEEDSYTSNQIVLTGTAYYEFNHSYKYWRKNQGIVNSRGDRNKLIECGADPDLTNWADYCVIRIPYDLLPDGFMEVDIITRAKNNMHQSLFDMEYMALFTSDTNGFFKRTLIERCVDAHDVMLIGADRKEYVIGIDPASEQDNFCIVVMEVSKLTRKVVYCWTTTRRSYKEELKKGTVRENDFYDYACRKILTLVNLFNVVGIAVDSQGGGHAIVGRLHNPSVLQPGENALWPIIDPEKPTEDDVEPGRHIIELVNFADSEWTSEANHGLRLDLETRQLLFPKFDGLTFAEIDLSSMDDIAKCDKTEEAVMEVEEMKNELSSIVMTQTPSGRDRWDTPEIKLPGSKKGRLRKDRYSALVMANALGKKLMTEKKELNYTVDGGGIAKHHKDQELTGPAFIGVTGEGMALAAKLNALYS